MTECHSATRLTILLVIGIMVIGSNSFVLSPILTDVAHSLATTPVVVARVISAYGAATAISAFLLAGKIDRFGVRSALIGSGMLMTLALLTSSFAHSWQVLGLSQALAGLAGGVMLPAIYTTATAAAPTGHGARVLGRVLNGWAMSLVAGVPVSALLAQHLSWRMAYVALALLALCATAGFFRLPRAARPSTAGLVPARAFRIPGVARLLGVCLCYMTAFYGTYAFLGDHVRHVTGVSTSAAGLVVLAYGAGFGLAGTIARVVDRLGPARVFPAVLAGVALVYLVMPIATTTFPGAIGFALVWGIVNHLGLNILVLLLSERHPEARGAILGLHSTATYLSVFAGPLIFGFVYTTAGFAMVTVVASGMLLLAVALTVGAACADAHRADTRSTCDADAPESPRKARNLP